MSDNSSTIKELYDTPVELFTPIQIDKNLSESLSIGKEHVDIGADDTTLNTNYPGAMPEPEIVNDDQNTNTPALVAAANNDTEFDAGEFLTAEMVISLLGFIVCFISIWALSKFAKIETTNEDFELTKDEQKTIKKPLEKCLETIKFKSANPWIALLLCIIVIYGLKFAKVFMDAKNKEQELKLKEEELRIREAELNNRKDNSTDAEIINEPEKQEPQPEDKKRGWPKGKKRK